MSAENVEVVRACFEAFDEGDFDRAITYLHSHVEWDAGEALLIDERQVHSGREAVKSFWRRVFDASPFHHEGKQFLDAGDHVCVLATLHLEGATSGIPQAAPCAYVWTVKDGLATHVHFSFDQEKALEMAGLSKQAHVDSS